MQKFQLGRVSAIAAAAALALGSIAPATAANDPVAEKKQSQTEVKKGQKYCIEQLVTGSRVPIRVCKTRDQWIKDDNFDPLTAR